MAMLRYFIEGLHMPVDILSPTNGVTPLMAVASMLDVLPAHDSPQPRPEPQPSAASPGRQQAAADNSGSAGKEAPRCLETMRLLAELGADAAATDAAGRSFLDYAARHCNLSVLIDGVPGIVAKAPLHAGRILARALFQWLHVQVDAQDTLSKLLSNVQKLYEHRGHSSELFRQHLNERIPADEGYEALAHALATRNKNAEPALRSLMHAGASVDPLLGEDNQYTLRQHGAVPAARNVYLLAALMRGRDRSSFRQHGRLFVLLYLNCTLLDYESDELKDIPMVMLQYQRETIVRAFAQVFEPLADLYKKSGIDLDDREFWPTFAQLGSPEALQLPPGSGDVRVPPLLWLIGYGNFEALHGWMGHMHREARLRLAATEFFGVKPLFLAARLGNSRTIPLLARWGLSLLLPDSNGDSCLAVALKAEHPEVISPLQP